MYLQVQFLLDSGAKVDERALCGATALHFAAECGHADVVCSLMEHNAQIMNNENGTCDTNVNGAMLLLVSVVLSNRE